MEIIIHTAEMQTAPKANMFSRKFIVKSRIVLEMENEKLKYSIADVESHERDIHAEDVNGLARKARNRGEHRLEGDGFR